MSEQPTMQSVQANIVDWAKKKGWHLDLLGDWSAPSEWPIVQNVANIPMVTLRLADIAIQHAAHSDLLEQIRGDASAGLRRAERLARWSSMEGRKLPFNALVVLEKLALVHSEVTEAVDAALEGRIEGLDDGKPEGLAYELADIIIRCFQLAGMLGIDLGAAVITKMHFNHTRPFRHGKSA